MWRASPTTSSHPRSRFIDNATSHVQKARKPRAITAYNLFMKDTIHKIRSEHGQDPDVKNTDALKMVGIKWKEIGADEKAKYERQAKELKEQAEGAYFFIFFCLAAPPMFFVLELRMAQGTESSMFCTLR